MFRGFILNEDLPHHELVELNSTVPFSKEVSCRPKSDFDSLQEPSRIILYFKIGDSGDLRSPYQLCVNSLQILDYYVHQFFKGYEGSPLWLD